MPKSVSLNKNYDIFQTNNQFSIPHLTANCSCGSEDQKCRDRRREEQDGEGEGFWDVEPMWLVSTFFVDDKTQSTALHSDTDLKKCANVQRSFTSSLF